MSEGFAKVTKEAQALADATAVAAADVSGQEAIAIAAAAAVPGDLALAATPAALSAGIVPAAAKSGAGRKAAFVAKRSDAEDVDDLENVELAQNSPQAEAPADRQPAQVPGDEGAEPAEGEAASANGGLFSGAGNASPMSLAVVGLTGAAVLGGAIIASSDDSGSDSDSGEDGPNRAPSAQSATATATEDGATITGRVTATDADGDPLTYALAQPVAGLTLNADGSYSFDPKAAAYQNLKSGETREVVANYTVSDGQGGTATSTLTITVTGANDVPAATAVTAAATEDGAAVTGQLSATDADGDALTYALAEPVEGLTLNADGSYSFDPKAAAYQDLKAGETREVVANYTVSDGQDGAATSTLTITVTGANDVPAATAVTAAATEDGAAVTGQLSATDADGDALTYALAEPVEGLTLNADGSYSFDPKAAAYQDLKAGETREVVANYTVSDGQDGAATSTLTITVTGANDAPTAVAATAAATENGAVVTGRVTATDVDGDALVYALTGEAPAGLTFNADGSYSFDPTDAAYRDLAPGETRDVVAAYTVSDGQGGTATSNLTITVTGANAVPVAEAATAAALEDGAVVTGRVTATDADGGTLTYALAQPVAGLTLNADGSYSFDPTNAAYQDLKAGQTRELIANYTASDGQGGVAASTLTITVTGINDAPVAAADAYEAVAGEALTVSVAEGVLSNDTDADGDALTAAVADQPANGTLTLNADGSFTYTPNAGFVGEDSFTYRVGDGTAQSEPVTVTLTVGAAPEPNVAPTVAFEVPTGGGEIVPGEVVVANEGYHTDGLQQADSITALAGGGYVVTWVGIGPDSGSSTQNAIYQQRYDANGGALGQPSRVNSVTGRSISGSVSAVLEDGSYVVAWSRLGQTYFRRYDETGAPLDAADVWASESAPGYAPSIAALPDGGFVLTWSGNALDTGLNYGSEVYVQRFDSAGEPVDDPLVANTHGPSTQNESEVTVLADGSYVLVWASYNQDGSDTYKTYARRFNADGTPRDETEQQVSTTQGRAERPQVAALADGGYVVTWVEGTIGGGRGHVFAQQYDANGQKVGDEVQVSETGTSSSSARAEVVSLTDGSYVVVWSNSNGNAYLQKFEANGEKDGGQVLLGSAVGDTVSRGASVTALPDGGYAVAWTGGPNNQTLDVHVQRFASGGGFEATAGEALDLGGVIAIADADAEASDVFTVTLSADQGTLSAVPGDSGATVTGSGTPSVTITGTLAQVQALLAADDGVTFTGASAGAARLTVSVSDGEATTVNTLDIPVEAGPMPLAAAAMFSVEPDLLIQDDLGLDLDAPLSPDTGAPDDGALTLGVYDVLASGEDELADLLEPFASHAPLGTAASEAVGFTSGDTEVRPAWELVAYHGDVLG